jgi:ribosomal protein S18 acetylase RimI-like enzyme
MIKVSEISLIENIFEQQKGKKIFTNSFYFIDQFLVVINENRLFYIQCNKNFILLELKPEIDCFELFYFIEDLSEPFSIEANLPIVMEIPYRGVGFFPEAIVNYWCNSGFEKYINRDLYSLNSVNNDFQDSLIEGFEIKIVDNLNDSKFIFESIINTFDRFTGDILSISDILESIRLNKILGAYFQNELVGFIRFYTKGKVSWIGHIATSPKFAGKGIGKSLVSNYMKFQSNAGYGNFQHWVMSDNLPALKLYNHFGFQKTNKSSLSLIKK